MELEKVKGIGKVRKELYEKMGIFSAEELVLHLPQRYEDRGTIVLLSDALDREKHSALLTVSSNPRLARLKGGRNIVKFTAFDDSATAELSFFCKNVHAIPKYEIGDRIRVFGRYRRIGGRICTDNPICEFADGRVPLAGLFPIYPLTKGLSSKIVSNNVRSAIEAIEQNNCSFFDEYLPEEICDSRSLLGYGDALRLLHEPKSFEDVKKAGDSISYREFFMYFLMLKLNGRRNDVKKDYDMHIEYPKEELESLPFKLTDGQSAALQGIYEDLSSDFLMKRIVIGDVGCGKTAIAQFAALMVLRSGYSVALMAPTEILARQHYDGLCGFFAKNGFETLLLMGSTSQKAKREIREAISDKNTPPKLIIGTHALISSNVIFAEDSLKLVIIDEQHRFGVMQRQDLIGKDRNVNSLSLSATPIPRTYAKMLYGDYDTSFITELPPGRIPVRTMRVDSSYRERLEAFIIKKCAEGRQVYVVCPAIEATDDDDDEDRRIKKELSAEERAKQMKKSLPTLRIGLLHGKMKAVEKSDVMDAFKSHELDVLVSTTVIEVGVNVPNATLMIIEGADRFGLAQLHQLRGRIARSSYEAFCVLVSDSRSAEALSRLDTLVKYRSGFDVSKKDLEARGPGDLFTMSGADRNIRQSGEERFKFARFSTDEGIIERTHSDAEAFLKKYPDISVFPSLKEKFDSYLEIKIEE